MNNDKLRRCYCAASPLVPGLDPPQRAFRCNVCCDGILEAKNELVREYNALLTRVQKLEHVEGVKP